jgi:hypothetical protein
MSPYQQDIIDTTLAEFDFQTAQGVPQLAANAITAGAFGGGRDAIANAQYASDAARNRAQLQASMLGQGFTQANQLANQGFEQQRQLASLQPSLAQSSTTIGCCWNRKLGLPTSFTRCSTATKSTSLQ